MNVAILRGRAIDSSVFKVAHSLFKNGYDVKLLVWDRQHNLKDDNFQFTIYRFKLKAPYDKLSVLFYLPFWWIYQIFFLFQTNPDIVHACDIDTLYPAIIFKCCKKIKLYYTIYDYFADTLSDNIPHFLKCMFSFVENYGIGFIDTLFLVDKSRYEQVRNAKIKSIYYLYNSPPDIYYDQPNSIQNSYKYSNIIDNNKFIIFYAGTIHKTRGIEYLIKAINNIENVKLIIAGIGQTDWLKDIMKGKNNVEYIGYIDYNTVLNYSIKSDMLVAFYDPAIINNKYASPNKLFEAMMCSKPIIMNYGILAADIIEKNKCGILVTYGDVEELRNAILELLNNSITKASIGINGRRLYLENYSWSIMESRLMHAYRN